MGCYRLDTLATSYSAVAAREVGAVASEAERRKKAKYVHLEPSHHFVPVAVESAFGPEALSFIRDLERRIMDATQEPLSHHHLQQRIAVAFQRGTRRSYWAPWGVLTWDCRLDCILVQAMIYMICVAVSFLFLYIIT